MNTFLKYFFTLGLLLIVGNQHLYSCTSQEYLNNYDATINVLVDDSSQSEVFSARSLPVNDRNHLALEEENVEEEEERSVHSVKSYGHDYRRDSFFSALKLISLVYFSKKKLLSYNFYFSYLPTSRRHLLLEIFRI